VDAKDLQILRLIGVQPFADWPRDPDHLKPSYLARRLGLGLEAAKARVRRMEREGVIAGYEIYPNYALLGLLAAGYLFRLPGPATARTMEDLQAIDGVGSVERFLGSAVCLDLYDRSPAGLERRVQLVSRVLGASECVRFAAFPWHRVVRAPTRLDWRIMLALRGRADRPLPDVAEELGVSARTVARRFSRLWEEGSVDTVAKLNTGRVPNLLFANFLVRFGAAEPAPIVQRIHKELDSQWAYCWTPPDGRAASFVLGVVFRSPAEVQASLDRLAAVPGVSGAEVLVSAQSMANEAWLTEAMARAAGAAGEPGPPLSETVGATRVP
jgi:DNA-binding Lrp family transcriptional regulator